MRNTKLTISFLIISLTILFAGYNDLYAGAGVFNPWGIVSPAPKGTQWKGSLVITAQFVDVPGLPAGLPPDAAPVPSESGYIDQIVKIGFYVRLQRKDLYATFSGLAVDNQGYYLFYPLADYANGRIGEALNKFLKEKVYPNLPFLTKPPTGGVLTSFTDDQTNVDTQLGRGLQAGTPLYLNANITVITFDK